MRQEVRASLQLLGLYLEEARIAHGLCPVCGPAVHLPRLERVPPQLVHLSEGDCAQSALRPGRPRLRHPDPRMTKEHIKNQYISLPSSYPDE